MQNPCLGVLSWKYAETYLGGTFETYVYACVHRHFKYSPLPPAINVMFVSGVD